MERGTINISQEYNFFGIFRYFLNTLLKRITNKKKNKLDNNNAQAYTYELAEVELSKQKKVVNTNIEINSEIDTKINENIDNINFDIRGPSKNIK